MTETKLVPTYLAESSTPVIVPPTFVGMSQSTEGAQACLAAKLADLPPAQWVSEWRVHPFPYANRDVVAEREVRWPTVDGGPLVIGRQLVRFVLIPLADKSETIDLTAKKVAA